ncbi:MAG: hypothetical protein N3D16_06775 [Anaerolineales bacterium]|nr:hypothetical protein [Anaerolineales bacterium]
MRLYGLILPPNRDQQAFVYPAQLVVLLLPFGLIKNVKIATAIWQGFSLICLSWVILLLRESVSPKAPLWCVLIFVFWFYPSLMIFQGQITIIPLISLGSSLVLYVYYRKDLLSGLVLSISVVKPELVLLPIFCLISIAAQQKRYSLWKGFLIGSSGLFGITLLLLGWWVDDWIQSLLRYAGYAKVLWPIGEIWRIHPFLALLTLSILIYLFIRLRREPVYLIAYSVPLGMLLLPQTLLWGLTMLLIPLVVGCGGKRNEAIFVVWLVGWLFLFVRSDVVSWKVQAIIMPLISSLVLFATYVSDVEI